MAKARKKSNTPPEPLRALEVMRSVPAGCIAFPIADERSIPHLRLGEFAVIDKRDRDPIVGELYLREFSGPCGPIKKIVQVCTFGGATLEDGSPAYMVGSYVRDQHIPGIGMTRMLDGAFSHDSLKLALAGRVIGILALPADTEEAEA
jgi:hypothetical protein